MNMNRFHRWYCGSGHWRRHLQQDVLPEVLAGADLGQHVLEIGPGRGASTQRLVRATPGLVVVELDGSLAADLRRSFSASQVHVVQASGTALPFGDATFDAVVCTTMLHHMPSPPMQDALLREAHRVLRPDGLLRGSDSRTSLLFRLAHTGDVLTPLDAATLPARLSQAGFDDVSVRLHSDFVTFRGRR
jgi:ubiquinone/menaquinone biosynthesis C-methylase UbiE